MPALTVLLLLKSGMTQKLTVHYIRLEKTGVIYKLTIMRNNRILNIFMSKHFFSYHLLFQDILLRIVLKSNSFFGYKEKYYRAFSIVLSTCINFQEIFKANENTLPCHFRLISKIINIKLKKVRFLR